MRSAVAAGLILGIALTFAVTPVQASERLRVGYPSLATALSPGWVTAEHGFWKKYDLDVELIYLSGETTIPALVGGTIQLVLGSDPTTTIAIIKGARLIRLGVTTNSLGSSLVTHPGVSSVQDLKGKTIGIGSRGYSSLELRLDQVLREHGIDTKKDVKFLPISGGPSGRVAALDKRLIAAAMITPPYDLVAEKQGLKILSNIDVPLLAGGINTTSSFLKDNREVLIRFLKGYMEGIHYMIGHKKETLKAFSKYLRGVNDTILSHFYKEITGRVDKGLRPDSKSVRFLLDFVALEYPQAKGLTEKDHWDLSLLNEIHDSGFVERLYRK